MQLCHAMPGTGTVFTIGDLSSGAGTPTLAHTIGEVTRYWAWINDDMLIKEAKPVLPERGAVKAVLQQL